MRLKNYLHLCLLPLSGALPVAIQNFKHSLFPKVIGSSRQQEFLVLDLFVNEAPLGSQGIVLLV